VKIYIIFFLLLVPTTIAAQNYSNVNKGDMQNMMQVMQKVQECMAGVDQTRLQELQDRAEQAKQEIDALCAQGQRDKAQKQAMAFGKEITTNPTMLQMKKCGEIAQGALPMMDMSNMFDEKEYASKHVCDD